MFVGPAGEPLFLQAKEAPPSVLETYGGQRCHFERLPPVRHGHQGYRVVAGQRILQAHSDRFLGWVGSWHDERDGFPPTDFYFRQFRDMKGSLETRGLSASAYEAYVSLCARLLARPQPEPRRGDDRRLPRPVPTLRPGRGPLVSRLRRPDRTRLRRPRRRRTQRSPPRRARRLKSEVESSERPSA